MWDEGFCIFFGRWIHVGAKYALLRFSFWRKTSARSLGLSFSWEGHACFDQAFVKGGRRPGQWKKSFADRAYGEGNSCFFRFEKNFAPFLALSFSLDEFFLDARSKGKMEGKIPL